MSLLLALTASGGPTNYAIAANAGSYSVTGQAATLLRSKSVTGAAGSYSVAGVSATVSRSKVVAGASGSYSVTGVAATVKRNKVITALAGAYSITGQDATIAYTSTAANYAINAESGAYSVIGQDAIIAIAVHGIELLGGAPSKLRHDKSSYWHRLLSPPTQYKLEALEPEIAQAIEVQAVAAIERPKIDPQAEMQRAMENMGIAYKQAYLEIYSELIAEMRQAQEDEQIATIMALML
jgi:hypothetical protein